MKRLATTCCIAIALSSCVASKPLSAPEETTKTGAVLDDSDWPTYKSELLHLSLKYPPSYTEHFEHESRVVLADSQEIRVQNLQLADAYPEGEAVSILQTDDARAIDHLAQNGSASIPGKSAHGAEWQAYKQAGMGDPFGYFAKIGDTTYIVEFRWGPPNPVSDAIFASLEFVD